MPPALLTCALCLVAYLLGSVPFALILGLCRGVDIRTLGSGNIGATNLSRALGTSWGVTAFALDFLKGLSPVLAAQAAVSSDPALLALGRGGWAPVLVGASAIIGHTFPVWLVFRGGKGVATTFGVMLALSWPSSLVMAAVWLLLFAATRTVSLASLGAALVLPGAAWVAEQGSGGAHRASVPAFALAVAVLIFLRHRGNIRRLLRGEELASGKEERRQAAGCEPKEGGTHAAP